MLEQGAGAGLAPTPRRRTREPRAPRRATFRTELRAAPTVLLVLVCLLAGIPATVALTPSQEVAVLGQHLAVGARAPSLSPAGPAQLAQIGNTEFDLPRLQVRGPLRPRLVIGPVQRNEAAAQAFDPQARSRAVGAVADGFVRWYVLGGLGLLLLTLAAAAAGGCLRMLAVLRVRSRTDGPHPTAADVWDHCSGTIVRMTAIAVASSALAWAAAGALAYTDTTRGLREVRSLSDLVGSWAPSPPPAGPAVFGFRGAVVGDSRAVRVGGPPLPGATPADAACGRSTDSLAGEIGRLLPGPVLNLACPSASTARGLLGPQERGGLLLPPQVGLLKQVRDLRFVVVVIGPNDVGWTDFVTYCYAVEDCADNLTRGEFDYRLAAFDRDYGVLLGELAALPDRPQVVVVTSYDVLSPAADCPDVRGPAEVPGLSAPEVDLLAARNQELNDLLAAGAEKYGFAVARPRLAPLCGAPLATGPDLQGLADPFPFHPTGVGSLRMAAAVTRLLPDQD